MSLISQIYNIDKFEMFKDVSLEQVIEMNKELINRAKDENNTKFNKFKDEVDAKIKNFEAVKYEAITERGIELKQEMDVKLELEEEKLIESMGDYLDGLKQDVKNFSKTMLESLANEEEQLIPKWNAEKEKAMGPAKQAAFEKLTSMGLTPNNPSAFYPALNDFKNNFENKWDGILKKKQSDLQLKKEQLDKQIEEMVNQEKLLVTPLAYIRGRSLSNIFFIIDEAQNLTPHEVKTIISRAGDNTKIVFTGDVFQIDTPYLDAGSNGLAYLIDRLKGNDLYAHITLEKGERSELANLANKFL